MRHVARWSRYFQTSLRNVNYISCWNLSGNLADDNGPKSLPQCMHPGHCWLRSSKLRSCSPIVGHQIQLKTWWQNTRLAHCATEEMQHPCWSLKENLEASPLKEHYKIHFMIRERPGQHSATPLSAWVPDSYSNKIWQNKKVLELRILHKSCWKMLQESGIQ